MVWNMFRGWNHGLWNILLICLICLWSQKCWNHIHHGFSRGNIEKESILPGVWSARWESHCFLRDPWLPTPWLTVQLDVTKLLRSAWTTRRTAKVLAQHGWRSWQQYFGISHGICNQNEDVELHTYVYIYIYLCVWLYVYVCMYVCIYICNMMVYGHIPTHSRYWPIPISAYLWQNGNELFSHQTKSGIFRGKLWIHAQKLGI